MIQIAKEFATELEQLCKKHYSKLNPSYTMIITPQDFEEGISINNIYKVVLLDQFYPENGHSAIPLTE